MSLLDRLSTVRSSVLRLDDVEDEPGVAHDAPQVVVVDGGSADDAIGELLRSVARGDREAFVTLKDRIGGLVRVNIHRVLGDASRADAVTQEFFAEVLRDAATFDPDRHSARAWLLTRAHHRAIDHVERDRRATAGRATLRDPP